MEMPDFWDVPELSQKKTIELNALKSDLEVYNKLISEKEDMETLIEMGYEEEDPDLIPEIQEMLDDFVKTFEDIRIKTLRCHREA